MLLCTGPPFPWGTVPNSSRSLDRLQPEHEAIQNLGISPQTATEFESGYEKAGILRGRYSLALRDPDGTLVGFVGIALSPEQSPRLKFPESVIAFATPLISTQQWEMLASFMDEHQIDGTAL